MLADIAIATPKEDRAQAPARDRTLRLCPAARARAARGVPCRSAGVRRPALRRPPDRSRAPGRLVLERAVPLRVSHGRASKQDESGRSAMELRGPRPDA